MKVSDVTKQWILDNFDIDQERTIVLIEGPTQTIYDIEDKLQGWFTTTELSKKIEEIIAETSKKFNKKYIERFMKVPFDEVQFKLQFEHNYIDYEDQEYNLIIGTFVERAETDEEVIKRLIQREKNKIRNKIQREKRKKTREEERKRKEEQERKQLKRLLKKYGDSLE